MPAQARYQFMLDNAENFVRTFIRGPVCRGQIATD
ncbi:fatty acid cis/trans isomerase [Pseudomonas sp. SWRI154]